MEDTKKSLKIKNIVRVMGTPKGFPLVMFGTLNTSSTEHIKKNLGGKNGSYKREQKKFKGNGTRFI